MDKPQRLGFIGIGLMGTGMTLRLLERGWRVGVWNLEPERLPPVTAAGAVALDSPAAVAEASDVVLMCVLDKVAVDNCVFGPIGIAKAKGLAGKTLVDFSTINPDDTVAFAARLGRETGMAWVDAPVSGGPPGAREGSLTVMAGGEAAAIARVEPIMPDLAANFTHMGPVGAGQTAKIVNQLIVGAGMVLMAEAIILAERAGIAAERMPKCLAGGLADSPLLQRLYPRMQQRAFDPPFAYARQLLKDMKNVKQFAHGLGLELPVIESATARFSDYVAQGNEMSDVLSILRLYEQQPAKA
jgi:3-hydroxyisobutyrate dehydrogenase